jgi:hypothetical protein
MVLQPQHSLELLPHKATNLPSELREETNPKSSISTFRNFHFVGVVLTLDS